MTVVLRLIGVRSFDLFNDGWGRAVHATHAVGDNDEAVLRRIRTLRVFKDRYARFSQGSIGRCREDYVDSAGNVYAAGACLDASHQIAIEVNGNRANCFSLGRLSRVFRNSFCGIINFRADCEANRVAFALYAMAGRRRFVRNLNVLLWGGLW